MLWLKVSVFYHEFSVVTSQLWRHFKSSMKHFHYTVQRLQSKQKLSILSFIQTHSHLFLLASSQDDKHMELCQSWVLVRLS